MTVSATQAAKAMCEASNWTVTNLQLQKLLYIANMMWAGKKGEPLIEEDFQAWDYGPVVPDLYRQVKVFGNQPIKDIYKWDDDDLTPDEKQMIENVWQALRSKRPAELVAITHRPGGAWEKNYQSGERHVVIPFDHIQEEFLLRNDR